MPIRKFRSVEEMSARWRSPGDPELYRTMAALFEMGRRIAPRSFHPGVAKFRSIDQMTRAQEEAAALASSLSPDRTS